MNPPEVGSRVYAVVKMDESSAEGRPRPDAAAKEKTLQCQIVEWASAVFPHATIRSVMAHLNEEKFELDRAIESRGNGYYLPGHLDRDTDHLGGNLTAKEQESVASEAADVMHLLLQVAQYYGFDLIDETRKKFEVNKARTWGRPDARGVVHHVEE